jgi:ArsR family transcriptional regulator, arsenate/arsenite/antimonite-responsive transcriptional repressor
MGKTGAVKLDEFFAALADRTRLRLLNLMRDGEVCVCFFAETIGTNNPKISRHLAYLKRAGLVKGRRDGKWMHYSISVPKDPRAADIFESVMRAIETDEEMRADKVNLVNVCCAPRNTFVNITGSEKEA